MIKEHYGKSEALKRLKDRRHLNKVSKKSSVNKCAQMEIRIKKLETDLGLLEDTALAFFVVSCILYFLSL